LAVAAAFVAACGGKVYDYSGTGAKGGARDAGPARPPLNGAVASDCSAPIPAGTSGYAYFYEDFTGNNKLYGLRDGSTSPVQLLRVDAPRALTDALAFDAANVYYVTTPHDAIQESDISALSPGGADGPRTLSSRQNLVRAMAVDETSLYVVETDTGDPPMRIGSIPLDGGCMTPDRYRELVEIAGVQTTAIAAHGGYIYWNELLGSPGGASLPQRGTFGIIKRMPGVGGNAEILTPNLPNPVQIIADDTGVYWLDFGNQGTDDCSLTNGDVEFIPFGTDTPITLATNLIGGVSMAVDEHSVYVGLFGPECPITPTGAGSIIRISVPTHETMTLVSGLNRPTALHVEGGNLYFLHFDSDSKTEAPMVLAL
jgi:hypothetical protein